MFDTSKDILFLVIALAVAVLTFFLCWFLYYMVSIIRQANSVVKEVESKIQSVGELIDAVKDKLTNSSAYLSLLVKSMTSFISYIRTRREKKQSSPKGPKSK
jgi:predicted PurR-regulated permease PerM